MARGPVQLLVVGFERPDVHGDVLAELGRLRESEVVRVIDLLVVRKGPDGVVRRLDHPGLGAGDGAVIAAMIGLDGTHDADRHLEADGAFWSPDEAIPDDSAAALALVEHRWAIGARDAIRAAGGVTVADAWVHPADLAVAGLLDAEEAGTVSRRSARAGGGG